MGTYDRELYSTHVWKDYVSKTFSANETHFPDTDKKPITTLDRRFVRYKDQVGHLPKQPWGRDRSYAGLGSLMLPDSHRPKAEPPVFVAKGHKHFGSGIFPYPTYLDRSTSFDFNNEAARRRGYPDSPMKRTSDPIVFSRYYRPANPILHSNPDIIGRFHMENLTYPGRMNPPSNIEKTMSSPKTMEDLLSKYNSGYRGLRTPVTAR
ncbi:sperm-associated microtubule inner protein 4-like [Convolutriloba macropyga]|uniref:sperm-associated microtubule inner protein 4-like n=1 Tax=Convolutriloba macropyga TaxID=536237 RepID=UPI003F51C90D